MRTILSKIFSLPLPAFIIAVTLVSCETEDPNASLPYEERIVVSGAIEPDHLIYLRLTRTLPPMSGEVISDELIDPIPVVTITSGDSSWTLSPDMTDPKVFMNDQIVFSPGKTYNLDVRWKTLHAYASTTIPFPAEIKRLKYKKVYRKSQSGGLDTLYDYKLSFKPSGDAVYQAGYILKNFYWYYSNYNELVNGKERDSEGLASLDFYSYPVSDTPESMADNINIFIDAYDAPYEKFFRSRNEGGTPDNAFGISGNNVRGNINGDGIGIFISKVRAEAPARDVIK